MTTAQIEKLEGINRVIEFTQRRIAEYMQCLENLQEEKDEILKEILEEDDKED